MPTPIATTVARQVLQQNLLRVQEQITGACRRAGHNPSEVRLVAITKGFPLEVVREAIVLGIQDLGENRVQEAADKIPVLKAEGALVTWHMVGTLQRNKVKKALELFDTLHSVGSLALAQDIDKWAWRANRTVPVLLEVNTSGEAAKHGFLLPLEATGERRKRFLEAVEHILELPHLKVQGLMTIAPLNAPGEAARPYFRHLRSLQDELARLFPNGDWTHLSMGMTDDFEVAVEEGATMVRIGRAIFGERPSDDLIK